MIQPCLLWALVIILTSEQSGAMLGSPSPAQSRAVG